MNPCDTRQLLLSVTRLVEKPDIRALELSLVATLSKIIKAESIKLCQLQSDPDSESDRLLTYSNPYQQVQLSTQPAFAECLQTERRVATMHDGRTQVIHPIKVRDDIVGFLVIDCATYDSHDQDVVSILLDFYKNYASLLYDAERDVLTGLLNRKSFYERVLQLIGAQRDQASGEAAPKGAILAVVDIDFFKRINDTYGHLVGDETLILFARAMVETFRGGDLLFRMGGEEFVVILKEIDGASALAVLDRFRQAISQREFPQLGKLTVSIGASTLLAGDLPTNTMDRADKALYYAKENGRNQVCLYEQLTAENKLNVVQRETDIELF
jgi:diguanylate cyclase (GGDEF)-like protein